MPLRGAQPYMQEEWLLWRSRMARRGKGSRHAIGWRDSWKRKLRGDNDGLAQVRDIGGKSPYIVKNT